MELFGIVAVVVLLLVPSLKKLLDSVAYRNRARGRAEIIRAERGTGAPPQVTQVSQVPRVTRGVRKKTKRGEEQAGG
ncbi:hypothetical protein AB0N81_12065 [Streptomyces sp. NPDC093510]|uniref:hypothetical protein n=1 Tax=Streptomyces sp. NPDC093510 TaxID=3155199 RepID=UPI003412A479